MKRSVAEERGNTSSDNTDSMTPVQASTQAKEEEVGGRGVTKEDTEEEGREKQDGARPWKGEREQLRLGE